MYPLGFEKHLISFKNAKGESVSALLFEAEEAYYLVRMTIKKAQQIIRDDEDYDDDGILKSDVQLDYSEKYNPDEDDMDDMDEMDEIDEIDDMDDLEDEDDS